MRIGFRGFGTLSLVESRTDSHFAKFLASGKIQRQSLTADF